MTIFAVETEIHVDDIGTQFNLTLYSAQTAVDLSSATVKQFIFSKPDGTKLTVSASFVTDGTDGKLSYTTIADDIDQAGLWQLQVFVDLPTGEFHSSVVRFLVQPNL